MSASSKPERPRRATIGARQKQTFGVEISQGRVVFDYAKMSIGEEAMSHIVQSGQKLRLHHLRVFGAPVGGNVSSVNLTVVCKFRGRISDTDASTR